MKYYIIAGEPSGDLHGSNLMRAIKLQDADAEFEFWGGDHMLSIDKNMVTHIRETAIMGFVEVVKNISKIKAFFKKAKKSILDYKPDVLVFIDYPGFNLRMAKWAKKKGFKTVYYISPQLWAWKKGRIETVKKYIDEMIVILPFELDFYEKYGVKVHYVGHPLLSVIHSHMMGNESSGSQSDIIAILPGSRKQEIKKILPELIQGASLLGSDFQLCIAMAPNVEKSFYQDLIQSISVAVTLIEDGTYDLLSRARFALVTSGTATLETALFGVPQVVCYKTSTINYEIGKRLVNLDYISLVNLIGGKEIVPELIQGEVNGQKIYKTLQDVITNEEKIKRNYNDLNKLLSTDESPSTKAGKIVVQTALS